MSDSLVELSSIIQRCEAYCDSPIFVENLDRLRKIILDMAENDAMPDRPRPFNPDVTGNIPNRGYVIAYVPRAGTTLLSSILTGLTVSRKALVGYPGEIFNLGAIPDRARHYGCRSLNDYARWALWESTDESGLFGLKGDLFQLLPFLLTPAFAALTPVTKFIYITRENVLLQAISFVIGQKLGRWTSHDRLAGEFSADFEEILSNVRLMTRMMGDWESVFSLSGIQPLRLSYEQIDENYENCIRMITKYLDVALPSGPIDLEVDLERTRGNLNQDLARRVMDKYSLAVHYL